MPGYWPTGRCKTERKSSRKRPSVVYVRCVARSTTLVASRLPLLLSSTSRENARGKKRTSPPLRPLDLLLYSALSLRLWRRGSFVFRLPFPTHFTFASSHLHSDYGCSNLFIPAFFLSFFLSSSLSFCLSFSFTRRFFLFSSLVVVWYFGYREFFISQPLILRIMYLFPAESEVLLMLAMYYMINRWCIMNADTAGDSAFISQRSPYQTNVARIFTPRLGTLFVSRVFYPSSSFFLHSSRRFHLFSDREWFVCRCRRLGCLRSDFEL